MKNKYNWSIIGHKDILEILSMGISNNRLSHAYLFLGAEHIGKTTLATNFAQILQCQGKKKPCLKCTACRQIQAGNHPDTQILQGSTTIKIEEVRILQHKLSLNPYNALYKIVVIINASRMTFEAQSAFLKTLEEPSGNTILILTSINKNKLLPTILSRCQTIAFKNVSTTEIKEALKKRGVLGGKADELARLSIGKPGLALKMIEESEFLTKREELIQMTLKIGKDSHSERLDKAGLLSKKGTEGIKVFLDFWLSWFRDLLLIKAKTAHLVTNIAHLEILKKQVLLYQENDLKDFINRLERAKEILNYNINLKLLLETLFLSLP
jgi:DNA polymerase III subunit delta'